MYFGRKWWIDRYPDIDSAVVAFHQDGPLRALQVPQIYAKAGIGLLIFNKKIEENFFFFSLSTFLFVMFFTLKLIKSA